MAYPECRNRFVRFEGKLVNNILAHSKLGLLTVIVALIASACGAPAAPAPPPAAGSSAYEGTEIGGEASDFQLVDQRGEPVRLSDFRGKLVVLSFLDSTCHDICPITAQHLKNTLQVLQPGAAENVALFAINVNAAANAVSDVAAASSHWNMDDVPAWHFLTGSPDELQSVWHAYSAGVQVRPDGEISHLPGVYVIDQQGQKRWYISTPDDPSWTGPALSEVLPQRLRQLL
jgi:cytochrome oxidase Cu insertion factor (SCO1/SenC/PrrC family)